MPHEFQAYIDGLKYIEAMMFIAPIVKWYNR